MSAARPLRLRVLLFEDNDALRSLLHYMLSERGCEVLDYPGPEECPLRHATHCACDRERVCADAIVTDWDMPGVDGYTFVHDLLAAGCRIPHLAMLTAHEDPEHLEKARALGFRVFAKSASLKELLDWLREVETRVNIERLLTPRAELGLS